MYNESIATPLEVPKLLFVYSVTNEVLKYTSKYCNTLYTKWGMSYVRICLNGFVESKLVSTEIIPALDMFSLETSGR